MQRPTAFFLKSTMCRTSNGDRNTSDPRPHRHFLVTRVCMTLLALTLIVQPLQAKVISRYAYVVDPGAGQILEYSINPTTGALAAIKACPSTPDPHAPSAAVVDRNGGFLYVVNTAANNVWVYAINPANGCLITSPAPGEYATGGTRPVAIDISAHDGFIAVADNGSGQLDAYLINNGILTPIAGSPFTACANPSAIAIDTLQSYLYITSNSSPGAICGFTFGLNKGWLSSATNYPTTGSFPTQLAIDPVGQFLYVVNSGADTVESYLIGTNGALTVNNTIATGSDPRSVAVNPFGQGVYVANNVGNSISSFQIELPPVYGALAGNGAAVATAGADGPTWLTVDGTGKFLYATDSSGFVSGYSINASTGALKPIKGSPWKTPGTGTSPAGIAIQP